MRAESMVALAGILGIGAVVACERAGTSGDVPAPASAGAPLPELHGKKATSPPSPAAEGSERRRVKMIVRPGDATVEVNGIPVERRDGVIELTGKVGESPRVRVSDGTAAVEQDMTIPDAGTSLPPVVLNQPDGPPEMPVDAGTPKPEPSKEPDKRRRVLYE